MSDISFDTVNVPVAVAAKALRMDAQTVRLLLQNHLVSWGCAFKRTANTKSYTYLIYAKKFYEETGFLYKGGASNDR